MQQAGKKSKGRVAGIGAAVLAALAMPALAQNAASGGAVAQGHIERAMPLLPDPGQAPAAKPASGASSAQVPRIPDTARPLPGMPVPPAAPASAASAPPVPPAAPAVPASVPPSPASAAEEAAPSAASEAEIPEPPAPNLAQTSSLDPAGALAMRQLFAKEVRRRLALPAADQQAYGRLLQRTLAEHGHGDLANEYVLLVDRSQNVQAIFIYFRAAAGDNWSMIGAAPVSTGRPGTYDHFLTPLGVFEHTPRNMDFRAEGTLNEFGIRGYGARDMRIYDFGWADGERGWGKGGVSPMRFQMHATDPDKLEQVLGIRHSKGCVRIPAALNVFFDHRGIIDADYEARAAASGPLWILKSKREPTPWAGRYLVVVDTERKARPVWAPAPGGAARAKVPAGADSAD
jgi:hypothetical protein